MLACLVLTQHIGGAFFRGCFGLLRFLFTPFGSSKNSKYAEWMPKWEVSRFLKPQNKGIVVSKNRRLSLKDSYCNVFVSAVTGAGKTSSIVIPTLLKLETSAVVLDVSGELYEKTAHHLKETKGYKIVKIDLTDLSRSPIRYNPLGRNIGNLNKLRRVVKTLLESSYGSDKSSDSYWSLGAENIILIAARVLGMQDACYQNFANLRHLLFNIAGENSLGHNFILYHADDNTLNDYKGWCAEPRTMGYNLSTAINGLELVNDPIQAEFTATDNLDFAALRKEKTIWYINVREMHLESYRTILTLLFTDLFEELMQFGSPNDLPVTLLIDEAATLNLDYPKYLALTRKYKISTLLCYQSVSQVISQFGKDKATTLINGACKGRIWLHGASDYQELKMIEAMLGKTEVKEGESTKTEHLLNVHQIRSLKNELLFFYGNQKPMKLKMNYYFKNKKWLKITQQQLPTEHFPTNSLTLLDLNQHD